MMVVSGLSDAKQSGASFQSPQTAAGVLIVARKSGLGRVRAGPLAESGGSDTRNLPTKARPVKGLEGQPSSRGVFVRLRPVYGSASEYPGHIERH